MKMPDTVQFKNCVYDAFISNGTHVIIIYEHAKVDSFFYQVSYFVIEQNVLLGIILDILV